MYSFWINQSKRSYDKKGSINTIEKTFKNHKDQYLIKVLPLKD